MQPAIEEEIPSSFQVAVLLASVLVVALCGIVYELMIATVSSYLLGNSVYQFSMTIGLFMFAMGIGSYLTRWFHSDLIGSFVLVEITVALIGGLSSTLLFLVFPYYAYYTAVMYVLILLIGTLVGIEIPLLTRILSRKSELRESIANVLSLDYLGALIGSVAFPIILLPSLGLFRASFAVGLLNVVVGYLTVAAFGRSLPRARLYRAAAIAVAVALIGGIFYSASITNFAEGQLFADQIIYRNQSPYQRIIATRSDRTGEMRLYLDGHLQFAARDEYRYHEALVHPVMCLPGSRQQVLILGGGDGLAAREVLKYDDVERIDLVDIDPAITELCSTLAPIAELNGGSLNDPRVVLHHDDAFVFVQQTAERFDRVIVDLPDPHNEVLTKLYSVEFYKLLRRCMASGAAAVTQSSSPYVTREVFWSIARTLEAASFNTHSYHVTVPSFGMWGFTLAAAGPPPAKFPIPVEKTQFMTAELMHAAGVFGKDLERIDSPVNSMFEPCLYQLYRQGVMR